MSRASGSGRAWVAGLALLGALAVPGCATTDEGDVQACAALEDVDARVQPVLDAGNGVTVDAPGLSEADHTVLAQWTYDLADASSAAADIDLRETIRRAADLAHDVYAGDEESLTGYSELMAQAHTRCADIGALR